MTYIRVKLPKIEELKKELKSLKDVKHYLKYEGIEGDDESIKFLLEKLKEYNELG